MLPYCGVAVHSVIRSSTFFLLCQLKIFEKSANLILSTNPLSNKIIIMISSRSDQSPRKDQASSLSISVTLITMRGRNPEVHSVAQNRYKMTSSELILWFSVFAIKIVDYVQGKFRKLLAVDGCNTDD